jgi:hypothetical protein
MGSTFLWYGYRSKADGTEHTCTLQKALQPNEFPEDPSPKQNLEQNQSQRSAEMKEDRRVKIFQFFSAFLRVLGG